MNKKNNLIPRFYTPEKKQSFFLFGPRGTGKSFFLKNFFPNALVIDLLDDATFLKFSNDPSRLGPIVHSLKDGDVLIIDEVQKAPQLLSKIHQLIEDDKFPQIQYILTGSSSRKLKRVGTDLLGGRAILNFMHPFMASELKEKFSLKKNLELGLLPVVLGAANPEATLASYIAVYLREEVKQEGLVKNLESFSRFLEVMSFSHGEVMNLSNIARECSIKRSTIDGYLEVLEDLLIAYRIPCFKKKNRKLTIDTDKFYYFDVGVFKSLRPNGPLDDPKSLLGPALEGLVIQNLKAWISYRKQREELYYWRTKAGNEVDVIIYGPQIFWAIEIKNSSKFSKSDLSGLESFNEDYPSAECFFLYRGENKEKHGKIKCLPIEEFLLGLTK